MAEAVIAKDKKNEKDTIGDAATVASDESVENTGPAAVKKKKEADRFGFFGGKQYSDPDCQLRKPVSAIRDDELKWIEMLKNWNFWMEHRFSKVKARCRKGIPQSLRCLAWQLLSGSKLLMEENKGLFDKYVSLNGEPHTVDNILKDVSRSFPQHELFNGARKYGESDLYNVLKAYTIHFPEDGYHQAQSGVASTLLMIMPAEQAFWCYFSICRKYVPGYYNYKEDAAVVDMYIIHNLLKKVYRVGYNHLASNYYQCSPEVYAYSWLLCLYTRALPWSTVLRVWDMFLCEALLYGIQLMKQYFPTDNLLDVFLLIFGNKVPDIILDGVKVLIRVGLVILKTLLSRCENLSEIDGGGLLNLLLNSDIKIFEEEFLVKECLRLPVSDKDMEKSHKQQKQVVQKLYKDYAAKNAKARERLT